MNKLKIEQVPDGLVVDRQWLKKKDINAALVDYYVRKGYLERVAHGAYRRPGYPLKWQHLVYSLQVLGFTVNVQGRSALELQGFGHYLPLGKKPYVHLFHEGKLPGWFLKTNVNVQFVLHSKVLFKKISKNTGVTTMPFGSWDWKINIASPERALLEMMADVPNKETFHMMDVIIEGSMTLRPDLLSRLLENCKSIKTKRLFLWFGEKYNSPWFARLNLKNVNLGSGKRVIQKEGKLDPKYLITVPKDDAREKQPVF